MTNNDEPGFKGRGGIARYTVGSCYHSFYSKKKWLKTLLNIVQRIQKLVDYM